MGRGRAIVGGLGVERMELSHIIQFPACMDQRVESQS